MEWFNSISTIVSTSCFRKTNNIVNQSKRTYISLRIILEGRKRSSVIAGKRTCDVILFKICLLIGIITTCRFFIGGWRRKTCRHMQRSINVQLLSNFYYNKHSFLFFPLNYHIPNYPTTDSNFSQWLLPSRATIYHQQLRNLEDTPWTTAPSTFVTPSPPSSAAGTTKKICRPSTRLSETRAFQACRSLI